MMLKIVRDLYVSDIEVGSSGVVGVSCNGEARVVCRLFFVQKH